MRGRGQGEGGVSGARNKGAITTSDRAEAAAKRLRHTATYSERLIWGRLRTLKIEGTHFRRQVPIGSYIVDFACLGRRLIVELDGGIHALPNVRERDEIRDTWLRGEGFTVIRIRNNDVANDLEAVMTAIAATSN
jgi:very-short-patch-repair endonuclease